MASSIAGMPSRVPGILIMTLGRSTRFQSDLAMATVPAVSLASNGETSRLTKPSLPLDDS